MDPRRSLGELPLFHLLRDDLPGLHDLLRHHVRTVGQWRAVEENEVAERLVGEDLAARVAARADLAEAFWEAWRIGRGRPVDGEVLAAAGLSATLRPRVLELAREVGDDAKRLVDGIEAGDVKHFRKAKQAELRAWLEEEGYLDERDVLDEDGVHARALAAVAVHLAAGTLRPEDVSCVVRALWAGAERNAG